MAVKSFVTILVVLNSSVSVRRLCVQEIVYASDRPVEQASLLLGSQSNNITIYDQMKTGDISIVSVQFSLFV